ncbi:MAG: hypothetical protein VW443_12575 [Pseudomonadales bacterium]
MALLVQTPRGTVSLPPQGFFQQQPSPFADFLSPAGLPPVSSTAVSFAPRIPAPADIDSAALVQERPVAPVIPQSTFTRSRPPSPGPAEDVFDSVPAVDPNALTAPDPASVFGTVGSITGIPGMGVVGGLLGNAISLGSLPAGIPGTVDLGKVALNVLSPFGLLGESVAQQTAPALAAINMADTEFALGNQPVAPPPPAEDPVFDAFDPPGGPAGGPSGSPGPGSANAANTGEEDSAEDPDGPDGDSGGGDGDSSYICTAAWDTGISAPATWSLNRRFGVWIRRNDPLAYEGYSVFGPWLADRIRDGKLRWIGKLKPRCWAYEMAQRSGRDTSGFPLSIKIVNRIQRATTRPLVRLLGWYVSK